LYQSIQVQTTRCSHTNTSIETGITRTLELPVTQPQQLDAWQSGTYIQVAMPELSPDQRELNSI
jgi:hypothetical protein